MPATVGGASRLRGCTVLSAARISPRIGSPAAVADGVQTDRATSPSPPAARLPVSASGPARRRPCRFRVHCAWLPTTGPPVSPMRRTASIAMCRVISAVPKHAPHRLAIQKICPLRNAPACAVASRPPQLYAPPSPLAKVLLPLRRQQHARRNICPLRLENTAVPLSTLVGVAESIHRFRVNFFFVSQAVGTTFRCVTR
jgi:hypothetical protein